MIVKRASQMPSGRSVREDYAGGADFKYSTSNGLSVEAARGPNLAECIAAHLFSMYRARRGNVDSLSFNSGEDVSK